MNVLFLTIGRMESIESRSLYPDLLRQFRSHGHNVYVVSAYEKRIGKDTVCVEENGVYMLHVRVGNLTKCNLIEKGVSTLRIESQFKSAIKKHFSDVKFDLVLYSTPPITLVGVVEYIKKRYGARTYLLLKDIFPQNAVDLGILPKSGLKSLLYKYFRKKEKKLYEMSDMIGCMSQANCDYITKHNPNVNPEKIEVCPNSIEVVHTPMLPEQRCEIREKYGIPTDKTVFVYGGNFGKPQGIPFIIECLKTLTSNPNSFFLLVGDGTDFNKLEAFFEQEKPSNMKLIKRLPKEDYDRMIFACDVGMIFLDHRFTIPNFPSRLLPYMQAKLPVLSCTDPNTDIGKVIVDGGFGWWCESNDVKAFSDIVNGINSEQISVYGERAFEYLKTHYTSEIAYEIITKGKDC